MRELILKDKMTGRELIVTQEDLVGIVRNLSYNSEPGERQVWGDVCVGGNFFLAELIEDSLKLVNDKREVFEGVMPLSAQCEIFKIGGDWYTETISKIIFGDKDDEEISYKVVTNVGEYEIALEGGTRCCEQAGILETLDDKERFLGAELRGVSATDGLTDKSFNLLLDEIYQFNDQLHLKFLTFHTNRGPFQIVAYNNHSGYYGHEVRVSIVKEHTL